MVKLNNLDLEQDLRGLIAEILESEPDSIDGDAGFVKDLGMDSMMALEILAGIEKKYKIVIPEDLLPKFTSLNETIRIVEGILAGKKNI
ncbi:MAG: acyl carrier protein [Candidatus Aceula meridiana]|nr:acyl carrier protein [Candidatus Aceula meridiana]